MKKTVFFEPKSLWKDDIYWFLKHFCLEFFGDGKYGLFSAKKLIERSYLLGLFELSMIFQDLGNMVFRAVVKVLEQDVKDKDIISNFTSCTGIITNVSEKLVTEPGTT